MQQLPEKTFENWLSIYLNNRFRSKVKLWWPSVGADIKLDFPGQIVGKTVLFELKTLTVVGNIEKLVLKINLKQLTNYASAGGIDYYVFPIAPILYVAPDIATTLFSPRGRELDARELNSGIAGKHKFINWTYVISGDELRSLFAVQISTGKRMASLSLAQICNLANANSSQSFCSLKDFLGKLNKPHLSKASGQKQEASNTTSGTVCPDKHFEPNLPIYFSNEFDDVHAFPEVRSSGNLVIVTLI